MGATYQALPCHKCFTTKGVKSFFTIQHNAWWNRLHHTSTYNSIQTGIFGPWLEAVGFGGQNDPKLLIEVLSPAETY